MMTRANKMVLWRDLTVSRVRIKHLAGDPARGVGRGEAGVTAGVIDDFGDLILAESVVAGDLHVGLELVGGAQCDQDAERDKAAIAAAQSLAAPEPAEDIVDTDLQKLLAELAVTQAGVVVGQYTGQQLTENLETLFTHICHAVQVRTAAVMVAQWR